MALTTAKNIPKLSRFQMYIQYIYLNQNDFGLACIVNVENESQCKCQVFILMKTF